MGKMAFGSYQTLKYEEYLEPNHGHISPQPAETVTKPSFSVVEHSEIVFKPVITIKEDRQTVVKPIYVVTEVNQLIEKPAFTVRETQIAVEKPNFVTFESNIGLKADWTLRILLAVSTIANIWNIWR